MKDRTTIQIPKEIRMLLKGKKIHPREPYGEVIQKTLKEIDDLKKKIKDMLKLK